MREVEFLPAWYPAIQRRYRWLIAQAWATLIVLVLLVGYAVAERWRVDIAGRTAAQAETQIRSSQQQLAQLAEKLKYENELRRQDQIVAQLGVGVETTRLLKTLEDAMTPEMALTNLSMETVEQVKPTVLKPISSHGSSNAIQAISDVDRRLKVLVDGVAPSDVDVASFMEHLQKAGYFENVALPYLREGHSRDRHVMREFEVVFEINLSPPVECGP